MAAILHFFIQCMFKNIQTKLHSANKKLETWKDVNSLYKTDELGMLYKLYLYICIYSRKVTRSLLINFRKTLNTD